MTNTTLTIDLSDLDVEPLYTQTEPAQVGLQAITGSHGMTEAAASSMSVWGFVCSCCCGSC